jgi:hypothetical protein
MDDVPDTELKKRRVNPERWALVQQVLQIANHTQVSQRFGPREMKELKKAREMKGGLWPDDLKPALADLQLSSIELDAYGKEHAADVDLDRETTSGDLDALRKASATLKGSIRALEYWLSAHEPWPQKGSGGGG